MPAPGLEPAASADWSCDDRPREGAAPCHSTLAPTAPHGPPPHGVGDLDGVEAAIGFGGGMGASLPVTSRLPRGDRPVILIADDNPRDLDLAMHAFARCGFERDVVTVRDGVAVMEYLRAGGVRDDGRSRRPAVVLLDMKMPRMDGLEALRQIKADPALNDIPVVLFSSSREGFDLARAYAAGANSYVVKPLCFERLFEVVRMIASYWIGVNEPAPGGGGSAGG